MAKQRSTKRPAAGARAMRPQRRATDLEFTEIDGEIVIYDETDDSMHHLNPTASLIWQSCDGTATIRELAAELRKVAGLPLDQVERDITTAVRQLGEAGLMQVPKQRKRATTEARRPNSGARKSSRSRA